MIPIVPGLKGVPEPGTLLEPESPKALLCLGLRGFQKLELFPELWNPYRQISHCVCFQTPEPPQVLCVWRVWLLKELCNENYLQLELV